MLRLNRRTWIQLSILALVTVVSCGAMAFNFMKLPATLFGIGEYRVTVDLPQSGGLYQTSVVTYRGTDVGQVKIGRRHRDRSARGAGYAVGDRGALRRPGVGAQPLGDR